MNAVWKFLDELDVRVVMAAAFNAGAFYFLLKKYAADNRKHKRFKAWALPLLTKLKAFHEARHSNEDLGDDWDEEGGR